MEEIKFNMNDSVKVKLSDLGISILKTRHEKVRMMFPSAGDFQLKLDEDGYYKTQLHDLFNQFGNYFYMGSIGLPFETNIVLIKSVK